MPATTGQNGLFTFELGVPVHTERTGGIGFLPRPVACAIEHIVGRVMHQPSPHLRGGLGQRCRGQRIHRSGPFGLALGLVHRGVGGGIDDDIGPVAAHRLRQALGLAQVTTKLRAAPIQRQHRAQRGQAALQLPAHLSVLTEQENFHAALYCFCNHSR